MEIDIILSGKELANIFPDKINSISIPIIESIQGGSGAFSYKGTINTILFFYFYLVSGNFSKNTMAIIGGHSTSATGGITSYTNGSTSSSYINILSGYFSMSFNNSSKQIYYSTPSSTYSQMVYNAILIYN